MEDGPCQEAVGGRVLYQQRSRDSASLNRLVYLSHRVIEDGCWRLGPVLKAEDRYSEHEPEQISLSHRVIEDGFLTGDCWRPTTDPTAKQR
jgi:hypothetical protein